MAINFEDFLLLGYLSVVLNNKFLHLFLIFLKFLLNIGLFSRKKYQ